MDVYVTQAHRANLRAIKPLFNDEKTADLAISKCHTHFADLVASTSVRDDQLTKLCASAIYLGDCNYFISKQFITLIQSYMRPYGRATCDEADFIVKPGEFALVPVKFMGESLDPGTYIIHEPDIIYTKDIKAQFQEYNNEVTNRTNIEAGIDYQVLGLCKTVTDKIYAIVINVSQKELHFERNFDMCLIKQIQ